MNQFSELDNLLDGWGDGKVSDDQANSSLAFLDSLDGLESELDALKALPPKAAAPKAAPVVTPAPTKVAPAPVATPAPQAAVASPPKTMEPKVSIGRSDTPTKLAEGPQIRLQSKKVADVPRLSAIYKILHGVSHCVGKKAAMAPATPTAKDVKKREKYAMGRNSSTNPSKFDFELTEYADTIFSALRRLWGIEPADYMMSLTPDFLNLDEEAKGSRGGLFYVTADRQYIIKSVQKPERQFLQKNLQSYYDYMRTNENSLLTRITGMYEVDNFPFIVMENVFGTDLPLAKYELRGENARTGPSPHLTEKDLGRLGLPDATNNLFKQQIQNDCKLVGGWGASGYSLLLGKYDPRGAQVPADRNIARAEFSGSPSSVEAVNLEQFKAIKKTRKSAFQAERGGLDSGEGPLYFLGIIDFLQDGSGKGARKLTLRKKSNGPADEGGIDPPTYAKDFEKYFRKMFTLPQPPAVVQTPTPAPAAQAQPSPPASPTGEEGKKEKKHKHKKKKSSRAEKPTNSPRGSKASTNTCSECGDPVPPGQQYCELCQAERGLGLTPDAPKTTLSRAEQAAELKAIGQALNVDADGDLDSLMAGLQDKEPTSVDDALGDLFGRK